MKTLKYRLLLSLVLAVSSPLANMHGQTNNPQQELKEGSTIPEILDYLNQTSFPYARIGLYSWATRSKTSVDPSDDTSYPAAALLVFTPGFRLGSKPDDCHIVLRNEEVAIYEMRRKEMRPINLKVLTVSQPPYAAEFAVWLETASFGRGKAPFVYPKPSAISKQVGGWRVEYVSRGFFARSVFGVRIPALKPDYFGGRDFDTDSSVALMSADRPSARPFDGAFRRIIHLCEPPTDKPTWKH